MPEPKKVPEVKKEKDEERGEENENIYKDDDK